MKLLYLVVLLSATTAAAQLTTLTFQWDPATNATGYRFYDGTGTNRVLLGATSNLTFTVTNWNVSTSRTVAVTATNILGESTNEVLVVPPAPAPVQNLKPIPLSIVSPVPGVVELSQDLVDWTQRLRLAGTSSPVTVTWVQYPKEAMVFMRAKSFPPTSLPPLPNARSPP